MRTPDIVPFVKETGALPHGLAHALRAMWATPARPMALKDLAHAAGTSTRTLQRQFRTFLGQTPVEALRTIRLEHARRDLLRGEKNVTVADIAARWGFMHFGRFSIEYRRCFGERPSETSRRAPVNVVRRDTPRLLIPGRDTPAIAVIPIKGSGIDPALTHHLTDELITALIRSGLTVTARPDRARYHMGGTCRVINGQPRAVLRLSDAVSGRYIWAFEHEPGGESSDDQLALTISAAARTRLFSAEAERVRLKSDMDLSAEELTMKAWPFAIALSANTHRHAVELLAHAMHRNPENALAIALAAWCHAQRAVYQFTGDTPAERGRAVELAFRGLRISGDSTTLAILGHAFACAHELEMADEVTRRALQLDGGSAWAWGRSAWLQFYKGHSEAAIERFAISLNLAPDDPLAFNNHAGLGCAYFHLGRYSEATRWMARAIANHPPAAWAHRILCPIYLLDGQRAEAEHSLNEIKRLYPDAKASQCAAAAPLPRSLQDLVAEGLESVGVPA